MAKKYKIPTPYGTETRTSEREYTHIVIVAGPKKESVILDRHSREVKHNREYLAELVADRDGGFQLSYDKQMKWVTRFGRSSYQTQAEYDARNLESAQRSRECAAQCSAKAISTCEQFLAMEAQILADKLAERSRHKGHLLGYAGSFKLAQGRARQWDAQEYENVQVIEITPDMITETKPRKKA